MKIVAVPGAALAQIRLSYEYHPSQSMNHPVAAEGPLGRKRLVKILFADIQHIFPEGQFAQFVSYHADDLSTRPKAGILRRPTRKQRLPAGKPKRILS